MYELVSDFCDKEMMFQEQSYVDESNRVRLDLLAENYKKDWINENGKPWEDWDEDDMFPEPEYAYEESLDDDISEAVGHWWSKYIQAFKYAEQL